MSAREKEAAKRRRRSTSDATTRARARRAAPKPTTWRVSSSGIRYGLFCFSYLRQTKGRYAGKPLALEPWQLITFSELLQRTDEVWFDLTDDDALQALGDYETFWRRMKALRSNAEKPTGPRIHREGLLGVSKKNGKSTGSSGIGLYLLVGDGEPGPEVYSTASQKEQARIVFDQACEMVRKSPRLNEHLRIMRDRIASSDGFYKVASSDAPGLEGINPSGVVNDEIHAHKTRELYDVLRSATIARENPLLLSITTAGTDIKGTIGGEVFTRGAGKKPRYIRVREAHQDVCLVAPRPDKQTSFYFKWYGADPEKVTRKRGGKIEVNLDEIKGANPSSFITVEKLQEEADVKRPFAIFLRYHANIWTRIAKHLFKPGAWDVLRGRRGDEDAAENRRGGEEEIKRGDPIVVTVDIGQLHDTSAVVWARPPRLGKLGDPEDPIAVKSWIAAIWPPGEDSPVDLGKAHYVEETDEPLRLDVVKDRVLQLHKQHRVLAVAADPYKFETQLQDLEDLGITVVRFDQGAPMVRASDDFFKAVTEGYLAHDGDAVLAAHVDAAAARDVPGGRFRLDKQRATEVMDGAVATAMAVHLCHDPEILRSRRPSLSLL